MKHLLSAAFIIATFASCGKDAKQEKIISIEAEVMQIHDEVMPEMDNIMRLKSQLSKKIQNIDSLQNVGISSNTLAEARIKAVDLNQKLNDADKLMMDWMHEYKGDSAKKLKADEAISYFEKEKERILLVKQSTVKSIQETKMFLQ
jgi:hypothetical protein